MSKAIDLTGKRYGKLIAKKEVTSPKQDRRKYWLFECDCGNTVVKRVDQISSSPCPSCGCWTKQRKSELAKKSYAGIKKGMLTVLEDMGTSNGESVLKCKCDCGNEVIVSSKEFYRRKSCGCLKNGWKIKDTSKMKKHGYSGHPAYHIWTNMIARCEHPKCKEYKYYGERGITVCNEWHDVKVFCEWSDKNGYKEHLTLERRDVNGNYEPSNCYWIPQIEQSWNKRNTMYIIYKGRKTSLAKLCNELGLNVYTVRDRWYRGIRDNERLLYDGDLRDLRREERCGMGE